MQEGHHAIWTTADERIFISRLGNNKNREKVITKTPMSRKEHLLNYQATMYKRTNWGLINHLAIMAFVDNEILRINSKDNLNILNKGD